MKNVSIRYRPGRENSSADALSRSPIGSVPPEDTDDMPVTVTPIRTDDNSLTVSDLLEQIPDAEQSAAAVSLTQEQRKDPKILELIKYLEDGTLPCDEKQCRRVVARSTLFALVDGVLFYVDPKRKHQKHAVVPDHLREEIMQSVHGGPFAGHFSGNRLFKVLVRTWWWEGTFTDTLKHCKGGPQCCIVSGGGRPGKPPLQPIPVSRPFQILGINVMDLPQTERGNKHCSLLGIQKLNTTACHPQCDRLTERFNRTLKTMLRKHADLYGKQWDQYLHGVLWAYRNTPHEATAEKPSYLLFGHDCRYPIEAAFLPADEVQTAELTDYRQELAVTLARARDLAAQSIQAAQRKYKRQYDRIHKCSPVPYKEGDWILIRFPHEESGKMRKLSRPWHGPYRVFEVTAMGVSAERVYTSKSDPIHVHLYRVSKCPPNFPAGNYWYGDSRNGPGRPPKWINRLLPPKDSP